MSTVFTPTKTQGTSLMAWADVATGNVTVNNPVTATTKFSGLVFVRMGRRSGSAFTAGWPNFRIELSAESSGTDNWSPVVVFTPQVGASIANTTLNGATLAGATSFVVAANTNLAAGDVVFVAGATAAENEICRVKSVSGTTITPEEPLTYAHANGAQVTDQADIYAPAFVDLSAGGRIRFVADNANGGQTVAVEATMLTCDDVTGVAA